VEYEPFAAAACACGCALFCCPILLLHACILGIASVGHPRWPYSVLFPYSVRPLSFRDMCVGVPYSVAACILRIAVTLLCMVSKFPGHVHQTSPSRSVLKSGSDWRASQTYARPLRLADNIYKSNFLKTYSLQR